MATIVVPRLAAGSTTATVGFASGLSVFNMFSGEKGKGEGADRTTVEAQGGDGLLLSEVSLLG